MWQRQPAYSFASRIRRSEAGSLRAPGFLGVRLIGSQNGETHTATTTPTTIMRRLDSYRTHCLRHRSASRRRHKVGVAGVGDADREGVTDDEAGQREVTPLQHERLSPSPGSCQVSLTENHLDRLLGVRAVCQILDTRDRTLRRWICAGKFPKPDKRIGRTLRWRESTVRNFIEGSDGAGV